MKSTLVGAALVVALAGAVLVTAPVSAAPSGATVTGVPASVTWANATQGGSEVRALVSTAVSMTADVSFVPVFGITKLCRNGNCGTGNNDIINNGSSMRFAARNDGTATTCANPDTSLSCVAPVCKSGLHATALDAMFVTSPATLGTGSTGKPLGTRLCGGGDTNDNVGGGKVLVLRHFYIGVIVPSAKNSGTYTATLTFEVQ